MAPQQIVAARLSLGGYAALQVGPVICREIGLKYFACGVITRMADAEPFAVRCAAEKVVTATAVAGYGYEDDAEMEKLAAEIVRLSAAYRLPISLETHRASLTQDAWRTVRLLQRIPELRLNGDFSHWYAG
jgi:sugar phosphate isomerase/epimerase